MLPYTFLDIGVGLRFWGRGLGKKHPVKWLTKFYKKFDVLGKK